MVTYSLQETTLSESAKTEYYMDVGPSMATVSDALEEHDDLIKKQQQEIDELKARISALEKAAAPAGS